MKVMPWKEIPWNEIFWPVDQYDYENEKFLPSRLPGDNFDLAIIGTMVNDHGNRVFVYDEDELVDIEVEALRQGADDPGTVLREDAAMAMGEWLEATQAEKGEWAPVVV